MDPNNGVLSFAQLAGVLVQSVKTLSAVAKGDQKLQDKEFEQKLQVIDQVMSLGFTMPVNMALSMHQILVQLLVLERIDISKDFLINKVLHLINKVLLELKKQKTQIEKQPLAISVLEQIKWTLFVVKDRQV